MQRAMSRGSTVRSCSSRQLGAVRSTASRGCVAARVRPLPLAPSRRSPLYAPSPRQVVCQGLFGLGLPEIAVIAGIAALVFGPSKLPELGKGLGKTVKSFQTAAKEFETELKAAAATDTPETEEAKKEVKKEEGVKKD